MGQWSSKMSNAALSYSADTWYSVYLWGPSTASSTPSDKSDGIREAAAHSFDIKRLFVPAAKATFFRGSVTEISRADISPMCYHSFIHSLIRVSREPTLSLSVRSTRTQSSQVATPSESRNFNSDSSQSNLAASYINILSKPYITHCLLATQSFFFFCHLISRTDGILKPPPVVNVVIWILGANYDIIRPYHAWGSAVVLNIVTGVNVKVWRWDRLNV